MTTLPPQPPPVPLLGFGAGLHRLLRVALDALSENLAGTLAGRPSREVIAPGSVVPADECCADDDGRIGQCHSRLSGAWPTLRFPQPDNTYSKAVRLLAVEIEVGVFRCVSGLDDSGRPPAASEITADSAVLLDDLAAMRATALGAFGRSPVVVGPYVPLGPSGYCAGGTLKFIVRYDCWEAK